ncbi:hypothetical protein BH10BAC5_BH10BAC5_27120 [soil metagenome]
MLNLEFSQKILLPEVSDNYYSRPRLLEKLNSFSRKRVISITAPAGYGKTSLSVEFYKQLKNDFKIWISLSTFDNSIENFYLLMALALQHSFKDSPFGANLKKVISKTQDLSLEEKINIIISSFSNDLHLYLKKRKKSLFIFLDDFHNIDSSEEISLSLNYFLDYIPECVHLVFISRREPKKVNLPKFLAKNWLGRLKKEDLAFTEADTISFLKQSVRNKKLDVNKIDYLKKYLKSTDGWITAIQLLLLIENLDEINTEDVRLTKNDIFNYFTTEVFNSFPEEDKKLFIATSIAEYLDKNMIEKILGFKNGSEKLEMLYINNVFVSKEDEVYKYHELFKEYLNRLIPEYLTEKEINSIYQKLGNYYLKNNEWRSEYIALNYLISGKDYTSLNNWIRMNATEKLMLIHSSGLFESIKNIENEKYKETLEFILLNVNTFIYKEKNLEKTLEYLMSVLKKRFRITDEKHLLIKKENLNESELNYYVEILMLICNSNFLKEGITNKNIGIAEHILKFDLQIDQEIQFIVSLVKSYISTGNNSKSKKYIERLKIIYIEFIEGFQKGTFSAEDNSFIENIFSFLVFFDYGDFKTGEQVIRFIYNNIDFSKFDITNYSQICFALFTSYNKNDFEIFYKLLAKRNKEKNKTIFSSYKNQYEFQSILWNFLCLNFRETLLQIENIKMNSSLMKNYIYFVDALYLYNMNIIGQPSKTIYFINNKNMCLSGTREIMLKLEANLLLNDLDSSAKIFVELNLPKRSNFTLFNQAVLYFFESYYYYLKDDTNNFKRTFSKFAELSKEYGYKNYILFRVNTECFKNVFSYAVINKIYDEYLLRIFREENIELKLEKKLVLKIKIDYLNGNRIFVNNILLSDDLWERSKSKLLFIYLLENLNENTRVNKELIINNVIDSKSDNPIAIVDVEINKVRKALKNFIKDIYPETGEKDILAIKDKVYILFSDSFDAVIDADLDKFRVLCNSININDNISALGMYKNDYLSGYYLGWIEDKREAFKYLYFNTMNKVMKHYEASGVYEKSIELLESSFQLDPTDEDIILKLMNIYKEKGEISNIKKIYKQYERNMRREFKSLPDKKIVMKYKSIIS